MRWRSTLWLLLSMLCFLGAFYFWRLGDRWAAEKKAAPTPAPTSRVESAPAAAPAVAAPAPLVIPVQDRSEAGNLNVPATTASVKTNKASRLAYRLRNTEIPMRQLIHRPSAILLENALLDTDQAGRPKIPAQLQSAGDPGSYIVQSRSALDDRFRAMLNAAGATIVTYIPNNAYLVRASASVSRQLAADKQTQAVVPYEPYYKLKPALLAMAVEQKPLAADALLNVLLFADAREASLQALEKMGAQVVGEDRSPFGPVLQVRPTANGLATIAGLSGVHEVEMITRRKPANDLSRVAVGISPDAASTNNYLDLSGAKVLVNVNDTGIDATHPDLQGRVTADLAGALVDDNGHGTHVAGIIAGSGLESTTVTNAYGSPMPGTNAQFRGMAPAARLFSMHYGHSDSYLQQTAARTNAFISNNSWNYSVNEYDLAAASYDAAVRDALPENTGSKPLLLVFPTGNGGSVQNYDTGVNDDGQGGDADTILSPATAKNVITVGAVEQPRNITNQTWICDSSLGTNACQTNTPWSLASDSPNQVTSFSGRGNVGIGIEGDAGRFKPDVVAPGAFVVSTRSSTWDEAAYYDPTNYVYDFPPGPIPLQTNASYTSAIFVPLNAVQLFVGVYNVSPSVNLDVQLISPSGNTIDGVNHVLLPNDGAIDSADSLWLFTISNSSPQAVEFYIETMLAITNQFGNFFEVLSNLNNSLGSAPEYYRYESGTSMAAADVAGNLALMQEFFEQRLHVTNSPAMMKALLINGARSLGELYNYQVTNGISYQGWGLIDISNSIPTALSNIVTAPTGPSPIFIFDQSPTNALATAQSHTRTFKIADDAQSQSLRFTLVWTDPPGDPAASIKLVNDLDLVVTNIDTGDVFFGNDINVDPNYNVAWSSNNPPILDVVNNVENVFLRGAAGTNYSVTVVGRHVNVNAVTAQTNNVVQDYALVVTSGDGTTPDAMTLLTDQGVKGVILSDVLYMTNSLPDNPEAPATGGLLTHQRIGANSPLIGTNTIALPTDANAMITLGVTNQWRFYVLTNENSYTNAAFVTFMPAELSVPREGVYETDLANANRLEADIDLYVSTDPGLTNLSPVAVSGALKSVGREGTELIVLSNAVAKGVYYIGVKSEDQMGAEYSFLGIFSQLPFSTSDEKGNQYLRGIPLPAAIPAGTPKIPRAAQILALNVTPLEVRRAVVTNYFEAQLPGQLIGSLRHNRKTVTLNNHTCATDNNGDCITNAFEYIYEDNGEANVENSRHSDGPGSLQDFIGEQGIGVWQFTMVNNFPTATGRVDRFFMKLEPQNLNDNGLPRVIQPHTFSYDFIDVPTDATNLTVCVSGNDLPMELYVQAGSLPSQSFFDYHLTVAAPGDCLSITPYDTPPLAAGRYYIGVYNPNNVAETIRLTAKITRNPNAIASTVTSSTGPLAIADNAVTFASMFFSNHLSIASLDVGLWFADPRISDLAITLISPNGTRILLMENRGASSTNGLGTFSTGATTSTSLVPYWTNGFEHVPAGPYGPGTEFAGWTVLSNLVNVYSELPAPWYSNNVVILGESSLSTSLPTTNSASYQLSFRVTHAPYLAGTVAWWPFDDDAADVFGGFDGMLSGDVLFGSGKVQDAFVGDGVATRMMVPRDAALDLGIKPHGFTIEGWINPRRIPAVDTNLVLGAVIVNDGFDFASAPATGVSSGSVISGWSVDTGTVDILGLSPGGKVIADTPPYCVNLRDTNATTISTNFTTLPGSRYLLTFAYSANPDGVLAGAHPQGNILVDGVPILTFNPTTTNTSWESVAWQKVAVVFTAATDLSQLSVQGVDTNGFGVLVDSFKVTRILPGVFNGKPIVEWNDPSAASPQGVQLWLSGVPGVDGVPGSLWANVWDNNLRPHLAFVDASVITNNGWQHIAMTYDAPSRTTRFYINGVLASSRSLKLSGGEISIVPRTTGDIYFGYHPDRTAALASFDGSLDEFGMYERPLTDCEVGAIFAAGSGGKASPVARECPVALQVALGAPANLTLTITNGATWTNGPVWETDTINFSGPVSGPATNFTSLVVTSLDPNTTVDDFVLSGLVTNYSNGEMHFNENTNLSLVPIKFAPVPYAVSNFPATLFFSNSFASVTPGLYQAGAVLPGSTNNPAYGARDWTVVGGDVYAVNSALVDPQHTNYLALAEGGVECLLPTAPGHRYQLTYAVRGPGAVSWWSGDIDPLSHRAWDILSANNGAIINGASNSAAGFVTSGHTTNAFYFPGVLDTNNLASKVDLGDPPNLHFTNSFTIEGWIKPVAQPNGGFVSERVEQLFFRGDSRDCLDPYYLGLEQTGAASFDVIFHIEHGDQGCGVILETGDQPVVAGQWQHIAAVFEANVHPEGNLSITTNELRLYLNGVLRSNIFLETFANASSDALFQKTGFTDERPFADLDPSYSPGVAIGNRSRSDNSQPYRGFIDELTVYGRALTAPELAAIAAGGASGKADYAQPPAQALAKVNVSLNDVLMSVGYGDNASWTTHTITFTAITTNDVVRLQGQLPGTLIDGVTLTELPSELNYLPEESLADLNGEDAYGLWQLEIWDTRTGAPATLLNWQLNFVLVPKPAPTLIELVHGVTSTNTLAAYGTQSYVVNVPNWAQVATNILLFAEQHTTAAPLPVGVLWSVTNQFPSLTNGAVFWPPVTAGTNVFGTNASATPYLTIGQPYYLTVTNPNPVAVDFAIGAWFDLIGLSNCVPSSNYVRLAGVPTYFQFDVPPSSATDSPPQLVSFWLSGNLSNVTVVLSQHLPLPDLTHFDYISQQPSTNGEFFTVVTNSTPFPLQSSRWYVGVFNQTVAGSSFNVQACVESQSPTIITLTNRVPYSAFYTNPLVAPPGPPNAFFYEFDVTNFTIGVLFELYDLTGDADLVLQRDTVPGMAPYFTYSARTGTSPEQIVLRPSADYPDLRGKWYLGIFNNEMFNVDYTIRAALPVNGLLQSAQPLQTKLALLAPPQGLLLQWNSVIGEWYIVEYTLSIITPNWQQVSNVKTNLSTSWVQATTPLTTFEVPLPLPNNGRGYYRVRQEVVPESFRPKLQIQLAGTNQVRLSWSVNFPGETLLGADSPLGPWFNTRLPVTVEGTDFVVYDLIGNLPRYYRLIP